jgi:hypothetical protein
MMKRASAWVAELGHKFRQFVALVMLTIGLFVVGAGAMSWRRESHVAVLGTIYLLGGLYLVFEAVRQLVKKRSR